MRTRRRSAWPRSSRCTTPTSSRRALDAGADIVGVNSRNLRTLEVHPATSSTSSRRDLPPSVTAVAESGLEDGGRPAPAARRCGYDAFLIGERFMTEPDPGAALAALLDVGERARSRP